MRLPHLPIVASFVALTTPVLASATASPRSCTIVGTSGADALFGTPGADVICGLAGDDTIVAAWGADVVRGGPGNDRIEGGAGGDKLFGGAGDDFLSARDATSDILDGGPGVDRARPDSLDRLISVEARRPDYRAAAQRLADGDVAYRSSAGRAKRSAPGMTAAASVPSHCSRRAA